MRYRSCRGVIDRITVFMPLDDDDNNVLKAGGYRFVLSFQPTGTDNAKVIKTSYEFIDYQGNTVSEKFKEAQSSTIESQPYTKLPATLKVVVTEELKPDVELSQETYKVGAEITFSIIGFSEGSPYGEEQIIDSKRVISSSKMTVAAADLEKIYPQTKTFSYFIDEEGNITER